MSNMAPGMNKAMTATMLLLFLVIACIDVFAENDSQVNYIGVNKVAAECQLSVFFDDLSNRVRLVGADTEAVVTPGLDIANLDSEIIKLDARVKFHSGEVQIPETFADMLRERLVVKRAERRRKEKEAETEGKKLERIVLDPGHGGRFPGACAHGLQEKDLNLWITHKVKDFLQEEGIKVILTRTWDTQLSEDLSTDLDLRCEVANSKKADLFVSIHANASTNPGATGFEVYIVRPHEDLELRSSKAARQAPIKGDELEGEVKTDREIDKIVWQALLKEYYSQSRILAEKILSGMDEYINDENGGVREAGFRVVKWTRCPAVLVEIGYMSNRSTAAKLKDNAYKRAIARGIANGILEFKKDYDRTWGFTKSVDKDGSQ